MLTKLLQQIGLSEKDAEVYLACLELGTQPASVIAKKAKLKRPTTYMILDALQHKGLVSEYTGSNVKYFTAVSPEYLLSYIDKQRCELSSHQRELEQYLPQLQSLSNPYSINPKVKFFEGIEGVENVMNDSLTAKGELRAYSTIDAWFSRPELKQYILWYGRQRVEIKKIPLYCICPDTKTSRDYLEENYVDKPNEHHLSNFRWLPKQIQSFSNEINIYDNKMAIACLGKNELLGILIESQSIADSQKSIFDAAWLASIPGKFEKPNTSPSNWVKK